MTYFLCHGFVSCPDSVIATEHIVRVCSSRNIISSSKHEILVAHKCNNKVSYHVIVKAYTEEDTELLFRNFLNCRAVAMMVNEVLGTRIQVRCRPAKSGLAPDNRYTSFIDLGIYNKDRALRLAFSSKITSPDRPFVPPGYKYQSHSDGLLHSSDDKVQKEKEILVKTLVVPCPCEKDYTVFEVEYKGAASPARQILPTFKSAFNIVKHPCLNEISPDLITWVVGLADRLPGARKVGQPFSDCRIDHICLRFTLNRSYASHCHCIGRAHTSHCVMIALHIPDGRAYQSCWDRSCESWAFLSLCPPALAQSLSELHQDCFENP